MQAINHIILVGDGLFARATAQELSARKIPFVQLQSDSWCRSGTLGRNLSCFCGLSPENTFKQNGEHSAGGFPAGWPPDGPQRRT